MRKKIIVILLTGSLIIGFLAAAQVMNRGDEFDDNKTLIDGEQEYGNLYAHYKSADSNIHISGTISLYDGEKNGALRERTDFRFIRSGMHSFTQLSYLQVVCNGTLTLQLDTVNKFILLSKDHNQQKQYSTAAAFPFEALLSDTSAFKIELVVTQSGTNRIMQIKSDLHPEIKLANITYNPKTYDIGTADIYWWKDVIEKGDNHKNKYWLTKISYSYLARKNFNANDIIDKIIRYREGKFEPLESYANYELSILN